MMRRTIVIGDIHGCYDELISLLEIIGLAPEDRVVAVGDLIVKGRKNKGGLDLFRSDERFSSVIGNHDLAVLKFWRGETIQLKETQRRACLELAAEQKRYT